MIKAIGATLIYWIMAAAVFFAAAGRLDLPMIWGYLVLMLIPSLVLIRLLAHHSPGLIEERLRPGPGERDRLSMLVLQACLVAIWILSGLDAGRFHWSRGFPVGLQVVGLVGVLVGFWLTGWAMWVNRFFSSAVRLQPDREQIVVTTGPYAWMRHPGYTGGLLFTLGTSLALGCWWTLLPAIALIVVVIRRTVLEDGMLQKELSGYAAYAQAVRFRLIPGVW
jgi:protein-S-isoprenylcysteine O-methyltransferase Ste14